MLRREILGVLVVGIGLRDLACSFGMGWLCGFWGYSLYGCKFYVGGGF